MKGSSANRLIVEQISDVKLVAGKLFDSRAGSISVKGVLLSSDRNTPSSPAQRGWYSVASVGRGLRRVII